MCVSPCCLVFRGTTMKNGWFVIIGIVAKLVNITFMALSVATTTKWPEGGSFQSFAKEANVDFPQHDCLLNVYNSAYNPVEGYLSYGCYSSAPVICVDNYTFISYVNGTLCSYLVSPVGKAVAVLPLTSLITSCFVFEVLFVLSHIMERGSNSDAFFTSESVFIIPYLLLFPGAMKTIMECYKEIRTSSQRILLLRIVTVELPYCFSSLLVALYFPDTNLFKVIAATISTLKTLFTLIRLWLIICWKDCQGPQPQSVPSSPSSPVAYSSAAVDCV